MQHDPLESQPIPPANARTESARSGRKRWLLLILMLLTLACTVVVWFNYITSRQSLERVLPVARVVAKGVEPHYLFSINGVQEPVGVAVNPQGDRIYVAESGGERLIKAFDREGKLLASFAPPNTLSAARAPLYVAQNQAGQVYVSDRVRHSIDIYDAGGNFKKTLKPPDGDSWSPMGVRIQEERLLVTDLTPQKHRALELNDGGKIALQAGREGHGDGPDELWFPNSAVRDARNRVYVSDSNNGRVRIFDPSGQLLATIPGLSLPRGLALDADQRLYVVDAVDQKVKVFGISPDKDTPEPLFSFGDLGTGNGEFQFPNDIALDRTDRLYIADRVNNRIQVWVY